ncbi:hypothetical protein [Microvirga ossetica]|uniref:hypothetical protein n=1 Tax=Microvirga ossetica TaxID=1882682 RepID=UPI0013001587|nr:hypothetical protein [Microvirga ossetica]
MLLPTARKIEKAPREKVANATSKTGSRMLRKKDCSGRLKNNKAFDTAIPERPRRRSDGEVRRPRSIKTGIGDENRRIRTDLAGWHHAFELRGIRQTTQPATGIMFRAEHFYSPGEESMRRLTYRQDYKQAGLTGRGFISGGRSGSFRFCVEFQRLDQLEALFGDRGRHLGVAVVMAHGHRVRLLEKVRQVAGDEGAAARKFEGPGLGRSLRALRCRPLGLEKRQNLAAIRNSLEILERDDLGHVHSHATQLALALSASGALKKNPGACQNHSDNKRVGR